MTKGAKGDKKTTDQIYQDQLSTDTQENYWLTLSWSILSVSQKKKKRTNLIQSGIKISALKMFSGDFCVCVCAAMLATC